MLLGIVLDGVVTLALGVLIGTEAKMPALFYAAVAALHGFMAGFGMLLFVAVRTLERGAVSEAIAIDQVRREPKVVPIAAEPRFGRAA